MGKAKTLTAQELRRVQDYMPSRAHAARNRAMLLLTPLAGMRVGEVAALTLGSVQTRGDSLQSNKISSELNPDTNRKVMI